MEESCLQSRKSKEHQLGDLAVIDQLIPQAVAQSPSHFALAQSLSHPSISLIEVSTRPLGGAVQLWMRDIPVVACAGPS